MLLSSVDGDQGRSLKTFSGLETLRTMPLIDDTGMWAGSRSRRKCCDAQMKRRRNFTKFDSLDKQVVVTCRSVRSYAEVVAKHPSRKPSRITSMGCEMIDVTVQEIPRIQRPKTG